MFQVPRVALCSRGWGATRGRSGAELQEEGGRRGRAPSVARPKVPVVLCALRPIKPEAATTYGCGRCEVVTTGSSYIAEENPTAARRIGRELLIGADCNCSPTGGRPGRAREPARLWRCTPTS
jgi:hypothetical protein